MESVTGPLARPSPSSSARRSAIRAPRWAPSPRSTTTCACSSPPWAGRTARAAREPIAAQTAEQMAERLLADCPQERPVAVLAPVVRGRKGAFRKELPDAGRARATCAPAWTAASRPASSRSPSIPAATTAIDVLVDRLVLRPGARSGCVQALEKALHLAGDVVLGRPEGGRERLLQPAPGLRAVRRLGARADAARLLLQQPLRRLPDLRRPGRALGRWTPRRVIPDESRSLLDGAIHPWQRHGPRLVREALEERGRAPRLLARGARARAAAEGAAGAAAGRRRRFPGVLPDLRRNGWRALLRLDACADATRRPRPRTAARPSRTCGPTSRTTTCPDCRGARLRRRAWPCAWAAAPWPIRAAARRPRRVGGLRRAGVRRARAAGGRPPAAGDPRAAAASWTPSGVGYLSLDRPTTTLSGGEAHRIRLAGQIGARMQGVLYVLDEPSVGLHPRDNERLLATLKRHPRPRQHGGGGGARRGDDPRRGLDRGPRRGRGRAWAAA